MIALFKKTLLLCLALFLFNFLASPALASEAFQSSLEEAGTQTGHIDGPDDDSLTISEIIGLTIRALLSLIGIVFIVLIIYAGIIWMTSRGSEAEAQRAKDIIIRAVIGLVIVLGAYSITYFVGQYV